MSETKPAVDETKQAESETIPNIRFVGKDAEVWGKTVKAEPFTRIESGMDTYLLPEDPKLQREGFYHPDAKAIVRLYPHRYKLIVQKGGK